VDVRTQVRKYLLKNFLPGSPPEALQDRESFLEKGVIDSTGVLELVAFLEENFKFKIEDEDLIPDNLDSVDQLVSFIQKKAVYAA
jgi:acyl carrier protein